MAESITLFRTSPGIVPMAAAFGAPNRPTILKKQRKEKSLIKLRKKFPETWLWTNLTSELGFDLFILFFSFWSFVSIFPSCCVLFICFVLLFLLK